MLKDLLSDLIKINDILFVVRSGGSIIEMRSNSLGIRQKDRWITIGENDGPCHMHIDSESISHAKFIEEKKPERTSYSVRFFDKNGERTLSAAFAKMYDEKMNLKAERKKLYTNLFKKYGSKETLTFN